MIIPNNSPIRIFISYADEDFSITSKLVNYLESQNLLIWVDWQSIPKGELLLEEIKYGIENSDVFLFLISPYSINSDWCNKEIEHACKNGKRIIPIKISNALKKEHQIHNEILKRNWIDLQFENDNYDDSLKLLISSINTNFKLLKEHTKYQNKATEWMSNKDTSLLLRGNELIDFSNLINEFKTENIQITEDQMIYQNESFANQIKITNKEKRINLILKLSVLLLSVFIIMLVYSSNTIQTQNKRFLSENLTYNAIQLSNENELDTGLLLGIEAKNIYDSSSVDEVLFRLILESDQVLRVQYIPDPIIK